MYWDFRHVASKYLEYYCITQNFLRDLQFKEGKSEKIFAVYLLIIKYVFP